MDYSDHSYVPYEVSVAPAGNSSVFTYLCLLLSLIGIGTISLFLVSYPLALAEGVSSLHYVAVRGWVVAVAALVFLLIQAVPSQALFLLTLSGFVLSVISFFLPFELSGGFSVSSFFADESAVTLFFYTLFLCHSFSREGRAQTIFLFPFFLFFSLFLYFGNIPGALILLLLTLSVAVAGGISLSTSLLMVAIVLFSFFFLIFLSPGRIVKLYRIFFPSGGETVAAIARGGLLGTGPGNGQFLDIGPAIFSSLTEQMGAVLMLFVLTLFFLIILLGYRTYRKLYADGESALMAFGFSTLMLIRVTGNLCEQLSLFPGRSLYLPFFSYNPCDFLFITAGCAVVFRAVRASARGADES